MALFRKRRTPAPPLPLPFCSAVVVAAGQSARMGGEDKIFKLLDGVPVLARTLLALEACPAIHEIVVVTRQETLVSASQLCQDFGISKATQVILGGETRVHSVFAGLSAISPKAELAAIHDGARPFVTPALIAAAAETAARCGAAAPAVPLCDTVKFVADGVFTHTPERDSLRAVQTPQVFQAPLIRGALQKALEENWPITDDCSAVERLGMSVHFVEGLWENIKLTTPSDFAMAEGILRWRQEEERT